MKNSNYIFGLRAIIEAAKSGKELDRVLIKKGLKNELSKELLFVLKQLNVPVQFVPIQKIDRITRKNHQGALAFLSEIEYKNIEELVPALFEEGKNPFFLILDGVTDVRNFGAIARTAECAGVHAIIIPDKGAAQINADAIKTSAGALNIISVCRSENLKETVKFLKNSGINIIAATEKTDDLYYAVNFSNPFALIMGAEDRGISNQLLAVSDYSAKIPILGDIKSLNVSVAASVIIYEAVRQRN